MSVPVYAAGTGKNIQLGAGALAPKMTSVQDSRDYDTKSRVTTAQTVYYGSKEWRVIGLDGSGAVSESGTVTLFAADKLKTQQSFKEDNSSRSYVNSDIKPVVDGYYSSLFSPAEQNAINARTLANDNYSPVYSDFCDGISDTSNPEVKLWLLSTKEADLIGQSYRTVNDNDYWWLRSPGRNVDDAAAVGGNGGVIYTGRDVNSTGCVRPAFNINLESVILTSAAVDGKDAGATLGSLKKIASYSGTEWKLTILDSGRNAFTASAGTGATLTETEGYTSWAVPVTFTGATSGTDEHISVILTDSDGKALYYGHIQDSVTIPTGLEADTYTLNIFNEKCNGDKKTDLSSPISTINLTVTEAPTEKVATPTFSPAAGTYSTAQDVTISCTTAGATIHYTTDGTAPTATSSTYSSPINVSGTTTIKAIALKDGMTNSSVASARYTISATPVDTCTITFDPNGGKGDMDDQTVDKGVRTRLNRNSFTRSGYSFDGWNTDPDGDGTGYEDKDYITVQKNITLYAQWERDDHEDDDEDEDDHTPASWILNPNEKQQLSIIFTGTPEGTCAGYQEQGAAAKAVFAAATPRGWSEAFEFNLLNKNRQPEMTLKKGTLTLTIPSEYRKAGRQFALIALTKGGQTILLPDTDTNPNTVTATINVEGYAFALIYKD